MTKSVQVRIETLCNQRFTQQMTPKHTDQLSQAGLCHDVYSHHTHTHTHTVAYSVDTHGLICTETKQQKQLA